MAVNETRRYKFSTGIYDLARRIACHCHPHALRSLLWNVSISCDLFDDAVFSIDGGVFQLLVLSLCSSLMAETADRGLKEADVFDK